MKYLALIADVVASKDISERKAFQSLLAQELKRLNRKNPALASPYTITLGDEFQALYRSPETLFADVFSIMVGTYPIRSRFAVGIGPLATDINRRQALGMDGPAFHHARDAINALKGTSYAIRLNGIGSEDMGSLLVNVLNMLSLQMGKWSETRLRIMHGLLTDKSVVEMALELRISKVSVYKNINAAGLGEIHGVCRGITALLRSEIDS